MQLYHWCSKKKKRTKVKAYGMCVFLSLLFSTFSSVFSFFPPLFVFFFLPLSFYFFHYKRSFFTFFFLHVVVAYTHTHMPTHLHGLQKLGLFVCVLFFFLTILWRTHTYLLHIFIFYWFSVCSVIGHKAPAFFVVVVVRSVVLSLLSLTSVLHFLASEVFLFFFFFC